ncbi:MAG: 5'-methylthioadenosine/S-adenosylhomocysteine nucleosidase [Acidimicrobiales bacterium]
MSSIRRALVLAPMAMELRPIVKRLGARPSTATGTKVFVGRQGTVEIIVSQLGVGPTVAARATERLLDRFAVDHVVVSGIAGGIAPACTIGSVIVPDVVLDVTSGREFRPSPLGELVMGGKVGTVDELIVEPSRLARLADQGVIALEMESTGVASVCEERGVPWSAVRVISDRPDDGYTDGAVLGTLRPDGSADMRAALRLMATRPKRIPRLVRLGRDSSMAAGRAAKTTLEALG